MASHKQIVGRQGEQLASDYLRRQGYTIIARNWRCPAGEIDVVAREGEDLVFVEVRARRGLEFGTPEESITARKQSKLVEVAQTYLLMMDLQDVAWRIDVVAIQLGSRGEPTRLNHIRNAVEGK